MIYGRFTKKIEFIKYNTTRLTKYVIKQSLGTDFHCA